MGGFKIWVTVLLLGSMWAFSGCGLTDKGENKDKVDTSSHAPDTSTASVVTIDGIKSLQLTVDKTALHKDENTTVTVMATMKDGSVKSVMDYVEWEVKPEGAVAFKDGKMIAKKDVTVTIAAKNGAIRSNSVAVKITWVVNGHVLPPEPEKVLNDSTLLGVDVNDNGVRDDVERWIYDDMPTYHHPEIERVIAVSKAKAYQMVLFDPTNKDNKVYKAIRRTLDCWSYYSDVRSLPFDGAIEKFGNRLRDKQFNTRKRLKMYFDYNDALSTKLTPLQPFTPLRLLNTSYCDQNIDVLP